MTRFLFPLAFALGLIAAIWIALMLPAGNPVALVAIVLIIAVYLAGFVELRRYRQDTEALRDNLRSVPTSLDALHGWLEKLPAALRHPVQRRIEGEPVALPGLSLTPYLTGLLVMLGLLGTFIGMIVTLHGAATALQDSADLHAIRGALAAPIAGMSLAFGTSIAGVATSALLGLAAAFSRRDRLAVGRELDRQAAGDLQPFSLKHQRQQTFQALHDQAQAFPLIVEQLRGLGEQLSQANQQLGATLTSNQQQLQETMLAQHEALANRVGDALSHSLTEGASQAARHTRQITDAALARFTEQTQNSQQQQQQSLAALITALEGQLENGIGKLQQQAGELLERQRTHQQALQHDSEQRFTAQATLFHQWIEQTTEQWRARLDQQSQANDEQRHQLDATLTAHNEHFLTTTRELVQAQQAGLDTLISRISEQLAALRDQEAQRGDAATARLAQLEHSVAAQLSALGQALEEPMARLIESASQAPRAAAEVIAQLRAQLSDSAERDNRALEERQRLMAEMNQVLQHANEAARRQHEAVANLVSGAHQMLDDAAQALARQSETQSGTLEQLAADVTGSAHQVASLGDALGTAVQLFSDANDKLVANLERIETSLSQASTRSDEQLAYYVEQAREVIDLSLASQKEVLDTLGSLHSGDQTGAATGENKG